MKLDDQFPEHPKVVSAGPLAELVQVRALCYCNRNLTDGFVPLPTFRAMTADLEPFAQRDDLAAALVRAGMWEAREGGFLVHDFLDYQPSKRHVKIEKKRREHAAMAGGRKRAESANRSVSGTFRTSDSTSRPPAPYPCPKPVPDPDAVSDPGRRATTRAPQPGARSRVTAAPGDFETFWTAYPKSSRLGKVEALKAWRALDPKADAVSRIMRSLSAWCLSRQWTRDGGQFIPWPQKWLRKRLWQETPEPATAAADSWEPPEVRAAKGDRSGLAGMFVPAPKEPR